jgi:CRISP-associated protein Cas1
MLNYGYATLESQCRIAALSSGLDPEIGLLHTMRPGRLALVYDLMEPLRPAVDSAVLRLAQEHTFTPTDFVITQRGVCRLHPQLARRVTAVASVGTDTLAPILELVVGQIFRGRGHPTSLSEIR